MGAAREQEVRIMGFVLLAAVVVGTFVAIFFAVQMSEIVRSPTPNASVSQSSGGSSLAGVLGQG
jgi:hypothetical protein